MRFGNKKKMASSSFKMVYHGGCLLYSTIFQFILDYFILYILCYFENGTCVPTLTILTSVFCILDLKAEFRRARWPYQCIWMLQELSCCSPWTLILKVKVLARIIVSMNVGWLLSHPTSDRRKTLLWTFYCDFMDFFLLVCYCTLVYKFFFFYIWTIYVI